MNRPSSHRRIAGIFLCTLLTVLPGITVTGAHAMQRDVDGCLELAAAVERSVTGAMRSGRPAPGPRINKPLPQNNFLSCGTTTAAVSRAFTGALRRAGLELSWRNDELMDPGDYCLGHLIDQCYPETVPLQFGQAAGDAALVSTAWETVVVGVKLFMPFGASSDLLFFDPVRLADILSLGLEVTLRTPRDSTQRRAAILPHRE